MPRGSKPGERRGGRQKGTPNRVTSEVRSAIAAFAEGNVDKLEEWLEAIEDPAKRLDLFLRVLEYHLPKLQHTERTLEDATDEELLAEVRRRAAETQEGTDDRLYTRA